MASFGIGDRFQGTTNSSGTPGGKRAALTCRAHRRTNSQDSAMSAFTPRGPTVSASVDPISSPNRRAGAADRRLPISNHCANTDQQGKKTIHERVRRDIHNTEKPMSARDACTPNILDGKEAEAIQKELDFLQQKLSEATAKQIATDNQLEESARVSEQACAKIKEQALKIGDLEGMYAAESRRAGDLEAELCRQKTLLLKAENEILQLKKNSAAKDDTIIQFEADLKNERQALRISREQICSLHRLRGACKAQNQEGCGSEQQHATCHSGKSTPMAPILEGCSSTPSREAVLLDAGVNDDCKRAEHLRCQLQELFPLKVSKGIEAGWDQLDSELASKVKEVNSLRASLTHVKNAMNRQNSARSEISGMATHKSTVWELGRQALSQLVEDKAQEIIILREQLQGKSNQLLMLQDQLEVYIDDIEKQLTTARQELRDEKLRCRMLQEVLDGLKMDGKLQRSCKQGTRGSDKAVKDLERRLTGAKAKAARLRGIAKTARAVFSSLDLGKKTNEVLAVESLLADAVAISGGLLHTCGGECNSWSLSQIPSDAELKLTGVPGLKGMVEELRRVQQIGEMPVGHNNPKQGIQYHLRLKGELEELRRECTRLLRNKFHLEECIRYLAARCQLYEGYCIGEDIGKRFGTNAVGEFRPLSLVDNVRYSTSAGKRLHKLAARGKGSGQGSRGHKNRVVSVCEIRDVQMETVYEAAALLGEMAEMKGTDPPDESSSPPPPSGEEETSCRDDFVHPPGRRERQILQRVAAVCLPGPNQEQIEGPDMLLLELQ